MTKGTENLIGAALMAVATGCRTMPSNDEDLESTRCEETTTLLSSSSTQSQLVGISGDELLALATTLVTSATYSNDTATLTQAPSGGSALLTLTTTYNGGEINEIDSVFVQGPQEIALNCPNRLEVGVRLALLTDDGAFNETWDAVLVGTDSSDTGLPDSLETAISATFDPELLTGSFEIVSINIEGEVDSVQGHVAHEFTIGAIEGNIQLTVESSGETDEDDEDDLGNDQWNSESLHTVLTWGSN